MVYVLSVCDNSLLPLPPDVHRVDVGALLAPCCGAIYDVGPDEVSSFEDAYVRMDVLEALLNGDYKIRVTRK